MIKKKKKRQSLRGKISKNAANRGYSSGYLVVPDGLSVFVPESNTKVLMDILTYEVKNPKHHDRDNNAGIAEPGSDWYKLPFSTHQVGAGGGKYKAVCLQTFGEKCPVCEEYQNEKRKGELDEDDIKALKPSKRNLYCVVVREITKKKIVEKVKNPIPQLFEASDFKFQEMFEKQIGEEEEFEYFADMEGGVSVLVAFGEGNYQGNKYPEPTRFNFVPRKKENIEDDIIDQIPCLDECLSILSYKAMKAALHAVNEEDEEEEEDEKPRGKKRATTGKSKKQDYGEDEEEDEDEEEEEEEEEEPAPRKKKPTVKPSSKKPKRKVVEEEEEEDEDEEEEEEEEEEMPKKSLKNSSSKKTSANSTSTNKCPHGHKFAKDFNDYDDCDECKLWKQCKAASK